ncbi:hypothetical protein LTR10_010576 [Elasticomyces elasticus]|uniref:Uncharacterized protein n=1 Tax=Elasticomyces elasticus TaxID=574655 RepID=A0AAN7W915_9PEZI|nr:hypothetical protein LTR10_010576 [Elasticomyces elasticus]KAK5697154.1 hypothetical protein LTR97_007289 [Elasticomyces elasticus]
MLMETCKAHAKLVKRKRDYPLANRKREPSTHELMAFFGYVTVTSRRQLVSRRDNLNGERHFQLQQYNLGVTNKNIAAYVEFDCAEIASSRYCLHV